MPNLTLYHNYSEAYDLLIKKYGCTEEDLKFIHGSDLLDDRDLYKNCKDSIWFFLRTLRIHAPYATFSESPYEQNIGLIVFISSFLKGYNTYLCNPRQGGNSLSLAIIMSWIALFHSSEYYFSDKLCKIGFLKKYYINITTEYAKMIYGDKYKSVLSEISIENMSKMKCQNQKKLIIVDGLEFMPLDYLNKLIEFHDGSGNFINESTQIIASGVINRYLDDKIVSGLDSMFSSKYTIKDIINGIVSGNDGVMIKIDENDILSHENLRMQYKALSSFDLYMSDIKRQRIRYTK